jgi:hypothetical protein
VPVHLRLRINLVSRLAIKTGKNVWGAVHPLRVRDARVEPIAYNMIITAPRQNDIIDPAANDNLSNLIVAGAFLIDALI